MREIAMRENAMRNKTVATAGMCARLKVSDQLLTVAARYPRITILTHNNPDPDSIAGGWALKLLLETGLKRPVRLTGAGEILRAENQKMVSLLNPPIELNAPVDLASDHLILLIDCGMDSRNHQKLDAEKYPVGVIDHHVKLGESMAPTSTHAVTHAVFEDLRCDVAASATIVASYLEEQGITPSQELATALVYGIRTETKGGELEYTPLDHRMLAWLISLADPSQLAEIEDAPLESQYFSDLVLALQSTFLYGKTAFCLLPQCQGPEIVGEMADLISRCEKTENVLCGAIYKGKLLLSARTKSEKNAAELIHSVLKGLGYGGGHPHRAGGSIDGICEGEERSREVLCELRHRWLDACGVTDERGSRLVSRSSVLRHL